MDPQRESGRAVCSNGFTSQEVALQSHIPLSCTGERGGHPCTVTVNETIRKRTRNKSQNNADVFFESHLVF